MRVVRSQGELEAALEAARREALAAFGDDTVFCERWVEGARHVEVQLLADAHGTVRALGERECSVQRRHQKVLEESPSPGIDEGVRARTVRGGGELRPGDRLPERRHRRVPGRGGRPLLLPRAERTHPGRAPGHRGRHRPSTSSPTRSGSQKATRSSRGDGVRGHAIEVRLYAEDPLTFLPQAGTGRAAPSAARTSGSTPGSRRATRIGTRYDPLIAKLIASGSNRDEAIDRLREALAETEVGGLVDEPAVPALARRAPGVPRRRHDDRLPHALPAAHSRTGAGRAGALAPAVPAQPPDSGRRSPPPLDEPEHAHEPAARRTTRSRLRCRGR